MTYLIIGLCPPSWTKNPRQTGLLEEDLWTKLGSQLWRLQCHHPGKKSMESRSSSSTKMDPFIGASPAMKSGLPGWRRSSRSSTRRSNSLNRRRPSIWTSSTAWRRSRVPWASNMRRSLSKHPRGKSSSLLAFLKSSPRNYLNGRSRGALHQSPPQLPWSTPISNHWRRPMLMSLESWKVGLH